MNIRPLCVATLCWPLHAMAIGYPSFSTEIPGVQLWVLNANERGFPEEAFEEDKNEFVQYCNGSQSIYVSSSNSPVQCKSEATGGGTYRIRLETTDRRISGLVAVSKTPLLPRTKALPITPEESERLRKAEEEPLATFAKELKRSHTEFFSDMSTTDYAKMLRAMKATPAYRKYGTRFKISSPNGFIYISAIGLLPEGLGWNIKNVVFREVEGRPKEIGTFFGCIEGFRDLNADGTPEVLTKLCANEEGTQYTFWSLTPTVRPIVTRSQ